MCVFRLLKSQQARDVYATLSQRRVPAGFVVFLYVFPQLGLETA